MALALSASRVMRSAAIALLGVMAAAAAEAADDGIVELTHAERVVDGRREEVRLPDWVSLPDGATGPARATYRMSVDLPPQTGRVALCVPGLRAHARIAFNGHVVDDRIDRPNDPLPRSLASIRLIEIPREFVRPGANVIEIEAAGRTSFSISTLRIGPVRALGMRFDRLVFASVIGPAIVAVVVASLGLCVLLLWARSGDPLYGYFAVGTLAWAVHDGWSVLSVPLMSVENRIVWWTSLYSFFIALLVIFCVRFAGWRWPRFEKTLWILSLAAPAVLYAAQSLGFEAMQQWWLLLWIGIVGVGLVAVGRYAWQHRRTSGALLFATGAVSMAFATRDWLLRYDESTNNPVYLVPYAGLLFVVLIVWMLIDRFVVTSRELASVNRALEERVAASGVQLVRALEQMRHSKEQAESANRAKSSFLAAASHDLRQPIHALGLYVAALADEHPAGSESEVVDRMKTSLATIGSMFDALLDVSRMDAGAIVKHPRPFAIAPLLHQLAAACASRAADKGLRFSVRIASALPGLHAISDPLLVERIVFNLLDNAIKYTRTGGVLLSCRLRGGASGHWRIEVWDTGPGIGPGDRERVFEEFYQVGNPERDRREGLGLGLSIVHRLTELLGHPVRLDTTVGRGSRFGIDVPTTTESITAGPLAGAFDERVAALHVAVIDDDPDVLESTRYLLERWGCRVHPGADANDVLAHAAGVPGATLQAIVADYRLRGELTGIEAVRALRAAFGTAVPALIVSGESSPERLAQIRASGFECIGKPVSAAQLRRWLALAARRGASERAPANDVASDAAIETSP